ncbi:PSME3-interacting protein [Chrysoperla carnea]|uniref:PSME3-interacting protein n=1 Tax=Chrysoperla carnea TaxID=189513 RepID=UPI001D06B7D4|nr:PSME3-interacting protein [Chrysoperla carnea]
MSSGFVSEKELAEARLKRQEEWEKVRTADQPLEAPETDYDPRSLFERLEEQRKKRDLEFEESRKLKNMIKGLDDDEIDFLDLVDQKKLEAERNKSIDEERELRDYRNRVSNLQEQSMEQRLQAEIKGVVKKNSVNTIQRNCRLSQNQLLKGGLVMKKNDSQIRKRKLSESEPQEDQTDKEKKLRNDSTNDETSKTTSDTTDKTNGNKVNGTNETTSKKETNIVTTSEPVLKCIGILPGLGYYTGNSSSDSDAESSDIEEVVYEKVQYDITGRKIEEKHKDDDS